MRGLAIFASFTLSVGLVACSSDNNGTPDSPITIDAPVTPDAAVPDAKAPDAGAPDAGPTIGGTVAVHDVQILGPTGEVNAAAGHGGQITISFSAPSPTVMSISHDLGPIPCHASYSLTSALTPLLDEGTVTVTTQRGAGPGTLIPDCKFQAATGGYLCVGDSGTGGSIAAAANNAAAGFLTYTDSSGSKVFGPEDVGRYLVVAANPHGGAAFPISGSAGNNTLGLIDLPGLDVSGGPVTLGAYVIAAGIGPVPATAMVDGSSPGASPDFLVDGDKYSVKITPGGGHNIASYTGSLATAGEHLALNAATKTLLSFDGDTGVGTLDLSGNNDVTIALDTQNTGTGLGIVVAIDTTDATDAGATDLGTNGTHTGSLTCAALSTSVALPKDLMGLLGAMHPTKIRVSVFRDQADLSAPVNVVAGHGFISFQSRTP